MPFLERGMRFCREEFWQFFPLFWIHIVESEQFLIFFCWKSCHRCSFLLQIGMPILNLFSWPIAEFFRNESPVASVNRVVFTYLPIFLCRPSISISTTLLSKKLFYPTTAFFGLSSNVGTNFAPIWAKSCMSFQEPLVILFPPLLTFLINSLRPKNNFIDIFLYTYDSSSIKSVSPFPSSSSPGKFLNTW